LKPIAIKELLTIEKRKTMESLIFLIENKDRRANARTCANSSTQQKYTDKEQAVSLTALTESYLNTAVLDTKQERVAMTANILNAFIQMDIEEKWNGEKIIMKIRRAFVNMLVDIFLEDYKNFVQHKGNHNVLYVEIKKALYRMLQ
jgi:hypothetical protein